MSYKYFLFYFLFLSNTNILAQKLDWFENSQVVDYYNPTDTRYHRYEHRTLLCTLNGKSICNIDSAFKLFTSNSKFIAPTYGSTKVQDGGVLFVILSLPGFNLPGLHPIKTKINTQTHTVVNFTLPGHALHPGMVERKIVQEKDTLFLLTVGTGYNNISQFFTQYTGNCVEQNNLEIVQKVTDFFKSMYEDEVNNTLKKINQTPCIVADIWGPVHYVFTLAFNDYINKPFPSINIPVPVTDVPINNQLSQSSQQPVGGATPEELGKILLKALKTNDKKLWLACFTPKGVWTQEAFKVESNGESFYRDKLKFYTERFDYLREKLEENGFANLANIKFSRVRFERKEREKGSYVVEGESLVHYFYVEFTYGTEFVGQIGDMLLVTYKNGNYFVASQGGLLETARQ